MAATRGLQQTHRNHQNDKRERDGPEDGQTKDREQVSIGSLLSV